MNKLLLTALFLPLGLFSQNYLKIHDKARLVDSHNDILSAAIEKNVKIDDNLVGKTHSDLARFKQGGVDVQIFSVFCDGTMKNPFAFANREMDSLEAVARRNPTKIRIVKNHQDLLSAIKNKQLAAMYGVEGGHMIENNLDNLNHLYARGTRYLTLTWNNSTDWATSAWYETNLETPIPNRKKGLSEFGKAVVKRMNELGMMVDLSHVGEQTFWDAISTTTKPVIVSHSNVYQLCPVPRNLKDDQIKAVAKNGGVIDLNFYAGFIDSSFQNKEIQFAQKHAAELDSMKQSGVQSDYAVMILSEKYASEVAAAKPPLSMLLAHLDYIVKLAGINHVGLGSDFDGIGAAPKELTDVTQYPLITKALIEKGYSKKDIYKILGGNVLRVLKANENN